MPNLPEILRNVESSDLVFSDHFKNREKIRSISEKTVEDFLLNQKDKIIEVTQKTNSRGQARFEVFYEKGKKQVFVVILDKEGDKLIIITAYTIIRRLQEKVMENANRFSRFASRLRS